MAIYGKELRKVNVRKFLYTVLDKDYIVEVETVYSDATRDEMYEFYLHRVGMGLKTHIIGIPVYQANPSPVFYTLEEALELVERSLIGNIRFYEEEVECLEGMDEVYRETFVSPCGMRMTRKSLCAKSASAKGLTATNWAKLGTGLM